MKMSKAVGSGAGKAKSMIRKGWLLPFFAVAMGMGIIAGAGLRDDVARVDAILVLGNKVESDGTPSPRLKARLDRAAELLAAGWARWIIVSGGTGKEGFDEARVMRDYLITQAIPADQVIMDPLGVDTFATAVNARRILRERQLGSVLVVSQFFHLPRCRLALTRCGIAEVRHSHARFMEWRDFYSTARELPAWVKYWLRDDFPTDESSQSGASGAVW